jgi:hypothetical protein
MAGIRTSGLRALPDPVFCPLYLSDVQPDNKIDGRDLEFLNNVFVSSFLL